VTPRALRQQRRLPARQEAREDRHLRSAPEPSPARPGRPPHPKADPEHGGRRQSPPYWLLWRYVRHRGELHKVRAGPLARPSPVRVRMIERRIKGRTDLRPADKLVALHLLSRCQDQLQPAWETQETIAAAIAYSADTVQRAARALHGGPAFETGTTTPRPAGERAVFVVDVCPKVGPVKPGRDQPACSRPGHKAGKWGGPMPRDRSNRYYPIIEFSELTGNEKNWFLKQIAGPTVPRPVPQARPEATADPTPVSDGTLAELGNAPPSDSGPQHLGTVADIIAAARVELGSQRPRR